MKNNSSMVTLERNNWKYFIKAISIIRYSPELFLENGQDTTTSKLMYDAINRFGLLKINLQQYIHHFNGLISRLSF